MCKHRVAGFSAAHRVGMSLLLYCLLFPPACSEATLQDHAVAAWVGPTCLMFWGAQLCLCVFRSVGRPWAALVVLCPLLL